VSSPGGRDGFWSATLFPLLVMPASIAIAIVAAGLASLSGAGEDAVTAVAIFAGSAAILACGLAMMLRYPAHLRRTALGSRRGVVAVVAIGLATGLACLVSAGIVLTIGSEVHPGGFDRYEDAQQDLEAAGSGPVSTLVLMVVALVVLAPLGEELVFRVILLRGLVRRIPVGAAALVSAVAFAAVHFDQYVPYPFWPRTLSLVVIGLLLVAAYRRAGYWAAVTAHATVNGVAAIALFATG
jgi:membrane protease YdiL (CAAX protease family)